MRQFMLLFAIGFLVSCGGADDADILDDCSDPAMASEPQCQSATPGSEYTERSKVDLPPIKTSDLPGFFDCVREAGGVLIAAHRAGPAPGYPENALETLQYGYDRGIRIFEVDVATSRDGVVFLHHDRSLGRTTTADGPVADTDWDRISAARLVDNDRQVTDFHPTTLSSALIWAVENGAVLEIDKKETTGWRRINRSIRNTGALHNVLLITYSDEEAGLVQQINPDLMITAGARGSRDLGKLENLGVDPQKVLAWTGTRSPDPAAWARNTREGVESAFGTLGRRGERLDDEYWADNDPSEYIEMIEDGLTLIATDQPYRLADAIIEDNRALNACGGTF